MERAGLSWSAPTKAIDHIRQDGLVTPRADALQIVDTADLRKARGAFFTPEPLARYVTEWTVRQRSDSVLEPSCGEAAFLLAAAARHASLPIGNAPAGALDGVELHAESAAAATALLTATGATPRIKVGDFFLTDPEPRYDAVIGNPPYVRYQDFSGEARIRSRQAALRAGVSLTNLASSWAAFTIHSALFLKPGGRLGLVVPAELLSVNYAAEVRRYLMQRFARVRLVLFTKRVFPGVLEEVVLLLAEGVGPTDHCELLQVHDIDDLWTVDASRETTWTPATSSGKWTSALIPPVATEAYQSLVTGPAFTILNTWGDTTLGMVTGNNKYFTLSPDGARRLKIPAGELLALSPPGSRHLRGLSFTAQMRSELGEQGAATLLFRPAGDPSAAAQKYIAHGERLEVNSAYKCRVRTPWWRVPLVPAADLLLTYMNADTPRLTTNAAGALHLNSVHGIYLRDDTKHLGRQLLPLASLNSATLLGAETVGRSYGGGMLKLEPSEADSLPIPTLTQVQAASHALSRIRGSVRARLREGRLMDAVRLVDAALLVDIIGVDRHTVTLLEEAHAVLTARRLSRGTAAKALA